MTEKVWGRIEKKRAWESLSRHSLWEVTVLVKLLVSESDIWSYTVPLIPIVKGGWRRWLQTLLKEFGWGILTTFRISCILVDMRCLVLRPHWRKRAGVGFHLTLCRRSRPHKTIPWILVVLSPHTKWVLQFLWLEEDETSSVWVAVECLSFPADFL